MAELINKTDSLDDGRVKLNSAITDAENAKNTANSAKTTANEAKAQSTSTQDQLDQIVIEGDSSVEAAQARVDTDGDTHTTLKERLDTEHSAVTSQLAVNSQKIDDNITEITNIKSFDVEIVNQKYVDAVNGDDLNAGDELNPFATVEKALEHIRGLSPLILNGSWEIVIKGTIAEDVRVPNMPDLRGSLKITGETDVDGNPTTIFDGATTSRKIAIWAEAETSLFLEVRNIHFKNYTNGFNGYGVIMKEIGILRVENCIATNCDIGFAVVGSIYFNFRKLQAIDCLVSGYRAQYSASGAFGPGSGGTLVDGCTSIGAPQGIHVSRGANVHIDYCTLEDASYAGVFVDMNSRVHVLGSHFKRNDYGVRTEGGAEWINNTSEPNHFYEGTVDANTVNYGHFGNSRETRLYSSTANNEFRTGILLDQIVHTGTTASTIVYNFGNSFTIPPNFFTDINKKLKLRVFGIMEGTGTKRIDPYTLNSDGSEQYNLGGVTSEDVFGSFMFEVEVFAKGENSQMVVQMFNVQSDQNTVTVVPKSFSTNAEKMFRIYCTLSDPSAKVTFEGVEVYLMG